MPSALLPLLILVGLCLVLPPLGVVLGIFTRSWDTLTGPDRVFHLSRLDQWPVLGMPIIAHAGLIPLGLFGLSVGDQPTSPWKTRPLRRFPKFPVNIRIGKP